MPNAQCPIPNAQFPIPNSQCPMPNAQCPIPNAQCPILSYYEIAEKYISIDSRRAEHDWVGCFVRDASVSETGSR